MAQTRGNESIPDPARSYERAKPEAEAGMGRLDHEKPRPSHSPDRMAQAVKHGQPSRQLNSEDTVTEPPRDAGTVLPPPQPVDHSMFEEEGNDADAAPDDIHDPRHKRHPRTEGKGGTP